MPWYFYIFGMAFFTVWPVGWPIWNSNFKLFYNYKLFFSFEPYLLGRKCWGDCAYSIFCIHEVGKYKGAFWNKIVVTIVLTWFKKWFVKQDCKINFPIWFIHFKIPLVIIVNPILQYAHSVIAKNISENSWKWKEKLWY